MKVTSSSNACSKFWSVHLELRYDVLHLFAFAQRRIDGSTPLHEPGEDLGPLRKYACILYHQMPQWDYPRPYAPEKAHGRYYLNPLRIARRRRAMTPGGVET